MSPRSAWSGVGGSVHDMTRSTGDIFRGPCAYCHVPHRAKGEKLWVSTPFGPTTGWGSRPIAQLCYTCHDSSGGGYNANDMVSTAYSALSHGYQVARAPLTPDGTPPALAPLPYVASGLLDCTTCHDPHGEDPPFIRGGGIDALCTSCHDRANPGEVGARNSFGDTEATYSLHPSDTAYEDLPANGVTNLHPIPDVFQVPTASGAWKLGGHRVGWNSGAGNMSCQTCHPVHGGWNYMLGVLPGPPASNLTPQLENPAGVATSLCQACHQGGDPGESVGVRGDHPINTNDAVPATTFPAGWPAGVNREVLCTSCHDIHGGVAGTSLLRQGGSADGWCFSCHSVLALTPPYHHSSREIDDPAIFSSVLTCGDCHGSGRGWTAHNGFNGFKAVPMPDRSALCEICHVPTDPLALDPVRYLVATGYAIDFSGALQPALHGPAPGQSSHPVDEIDDDSIANCQIRTAAWPRTGAVSRYGTLGEVICESCHAVRNNSGILLGVDDTARLTGGWKTNLLVEAYEDNSPGTGVEKPDWVPGPTLSALCRGCHYSVREGNPPSFVHNPAAHTVEGYLYPEHLTPQGRGTRGLLTVPNNSRGAECPEVSVADQQASPSGNGPVPGAFSYPSPNVLDCDSCHRPHGAHPASEDADTRKRRLLEYTSPGAHGTAPCLECHDTDFQCGYQSAP